MFKEKSEHSDSVFLVVKHHTICRESKEPRDGWRPVSVTNPRTGESITKYIYAYDSVSGFVDKIEWYDRTDEQSGARFIGYKIHMSDGDQSAILDLPFRSMGYRVFMKIAENLDYGKPVEFSAWYDRKEDRTAFLARQDGTSVKHRYTVSNPGDCPPPVKNDLTGKWDFSAQEVWLKDRIDREVVPVVEQWAEYRAANAPTVEEAPLAHMSEHTVQFTEEDKRRAAMAAQAPRPSAPPAAPKPQGPPRPAALPRPSAPPPQDDPYAGGTFSDDIPF